MPISPTAPRPPHGEDIVEMYRLLLGRSPDEAGLTFWLSVAEKRGLEAVESGIRQSPEYRQREDNDVSTQQIYRGYEMTELAIIREFENPSAAAEPGFVVDFMGGKVRTSSLWKSARVLDGQVTPLPIPGDYHSEAVEWLGVLKSIRAARQQFVALEMGAGLGPWLVAGGMGARQRGIRDIRLYGVEGDPTHFELLRQNLSDNGFPPEEHTVLHAAIGVAASQAQWPIHQDAREDWGSRPIPGAGATDYLGRSFERLVPVDVIAFSELLRRERLWNLVHVDIQGEELNICESALPELNERVHWLVVGTHSRLIDGQMISLLHSQNWELENEKPARIHYTREALSLEAMTRLDGVQVWRNPRLA